jgi:hypothetical protein
MEQKSIPLDPTVEDNFRSADYTDYADFFESLVAPGKKSAAFLVAALSSCGER